MANPQRRQDTNSLKWNGLGMAVRFRFRKSGMLRLHSCQWQMTNLTHCPKLHRSTFAADSPFFKKKKKKPKTWPNISPRFFFFFFFKKKKKKTNNWAQHSTLFSFFFFFLKNCCSFIFLLLLVGWSIALPSLSLSVFSTRFSILSIPII